MKKQQPYQVTEYVLDTSDIKDAILLYLQERHDEAKGGNVNQCTLEISGDGDEHGAQACFRWNKR